MVVSVLQSNYIPWKGYFDIIGLSDVFIFYDDVQFTKNDWRNRNKIKTSNGLQWLSVPCGDNINRLIQDVEISNTMWQKKHLGALTQNYSKTKYFKKYLPLLENIFIHHQWVNLSELNQYIIKTISEEILGFRTVFRKSCDFTLIGNKNERLLNLLLQNKATIYLSGPSAKNYLDTISFNEAGIEVQWMDYSNYCEYPQLYPPFEHAVTIFDLIFNCGPESIKYMKSYER